MEAYEKGDFLGEGTYATVYKAIQKSTGRPVALKKFKVGNKDYGLPPTAIREIKSMREVHSPFVIDLIDCFAHKNNIYLVLEYAPNESLEELVRDQSIYLTEGDVKTYLHMMLSALQAVHAATFVHRDIKPNNILIAADGSVKLADFGLARTIGTPGLNYSPHAFADWYRPPEMLLGAKKYTSAVDIWALGCTFAELLLREPLFFVNPNEWTQLRQMKLIFSVLGTPDEGRWPGCSDLPGYVAFNAMAPIPLSQYFKTKRATVSDDGLDLLHRMLSLNPSQRITAEQALQHRFFKSGVPRTPIDKLPRPRPKQQRAADMLPLGGYAADGVARRRGGGGDDKNEKEEDEQPKAKRRLNAPDFATAQRNVAPRPTLASDDANDLRKSLFD